MPPFSPAARSRLLLLLLLKNLLLRRFGLRFRLLALLLLLKEAEPEDVEEWGAGGGLEELAVKAEYTQHLVQCTSAPLRRPPLPPNCRSWCGKLGLFLPHR
jgi:hypothetical protein